ESCGDVLGVFDSVLFDPVQRRVGPGDRFFLYSDGLIESYEDGNCPREVAMAAFSSACSQTRSLSIAEAVPLIADLLFPSKDSLKDDLVLVGVEV
ncbi:MAG: SpoIIE family protein phosphatase, partial [Acidobacteriota bacterium]